MDRERIMQALVNQLTPAAAWGTISRRLEHWTKVSAQPALFVMEALLRSPTEIYPDTTAVRPRVIAKHCEVWIYALNSDSTIPPTTQINALVDAVEIALTPTEPFRQPLTLGLREVVSCRIEGGIMIYPGSLGMQSIAIIPVVLKIAELLD